MAVSVATGYPSIYTEECRRQINLLCGYNAMTNNQRKPRLGGNVHAEAITDRIVHNSIWIEMGDTNIKEILAKKTVNR